jgi:hypothetical protein
VKEYQGSLIAFDSAADTGEWATRGVVLQREIGPLREELKKLRAFVPNSRRLLQAVQWLQRAGWDNKGCREEVIEALGDMENALAKLEIE